MALEVDGKEILNEGELIELAHGLPDNVVGSGAFQAAWAGEPVSPVEVHAALNVGARLAARTEEARQIIDRACSRIEAAFPKESWPQRPQGAAA